MARKWIVKWLFGFRGLDGVRGRGEEAVVGGCAVLRTVLRTPQALTWWQARTEPGNMEY